MMHDIVNTFPANKFPVHDHVVTFKFDKYSIWYIPTK